MAEGPSFSEASTESCARYCAQNVSHHLMTVFGQPHIAAARVSVVGDAINQAFLFKPGNPAQNSRRWYARVKTNRRYLHFGPATISDVKVEKDVPTGFSKQTAPSAGYVTFSTKTVNRYGEFQAFQFWISEGVQTKLLRPTNAHDDRRPSSTSTVGTRPLRTLSKLMIVQRPLKITHVDFG